MMLDYMGWQEAARLVEDVLEEAFSEGRATIDLARLMDGGIAMGTKEFTDYLVTKIYERS